MATTVLSVPDISCEHCQNAITKALTPVDGVQSVNVDIPTKKVTVTYDGAKVNIDRFKTILEDEDYPVESAESV
jgi:copper chaperone